MARQGLMDDSGYQGFEECSRYEECFNEAYMQGRLDAIEEIATKLEEELTMVMPRDKVKYVMYKVHTVLEQLKEQRK